MTEQEYVVANENQVSQHELYIASSDHARKSLYRPHGTHRHSDAAETTRYFSQVETSFIHRNQSLSSGSVIDTFSNTYMPNAVMRANKLDVADVTDATIKTATAMQWPWCCASEFASVVLTNDGLPQ